MIWPRCYGLFALYRESDVQALRRLPMTVAEESSIYADCAYTDYCA
jgi:hypothetical protein